MERRVTKRSWRGVALARPGYIFPSRSIRLFLPGAVLAWRPRRRRLSALGQELVPLPWSCVFSVRGQLPPLLPGPPSSRPPLSLAPLDSTLEDSSPAPPLAGLTSRLPFSTSLWLCASWPSRPPSPPPSFCPWLGTRLPTAR